MANPIVIAGLVRLCVRFLQRKGPAIGAAIIDARHADSAGGRRLTREERHALARLILSTAADEDQWGDGCESY